MPDDSTVFYNNDPVRDIKAESEKIFTQMISFLKEWISIKVKDGKAVRDVKPWQKV